MRTNRRHYRITEGDALEAHDLALLKGGRPGILDLDRVLSAIGRPYHGYHPRIHAKAAALLQGVATSHGFTDGNKRTAVLLTDLLLDRSGYELAPVDAEEDLDEALEKFVIAVVTKEYTFDGMVAWFKARVCRNADRARRSASRPKRPPRGPEEEGKRRRDEASE